MSPLQGEKPQNCHLNNFNTGGCPAGNKQKTVVATFLKSEDFSVEFVTDNEQSKTGGEYCYDSRVCRGNAFDRVCVCLSILFPI